MFPTQWNATIFQSLISQNFYRLEVIICTQLSANLRNKTPYFYSAKLSDLKTVLTDLRLNTATTILYLGTFFI